MLQKKNRVSSEGPPRPYDLSAVAVATVAVVAAAVVVAVGMGAAAGRSVVPMRSRNGTSAARTCGASIGMRLHASR